MKIRIRKRSRRSVLTVTIRLPKQSADERLIAKTFERSLRALRRSQKLPSIAQLKAAISIERTIADSLGREPVTIRGEPRFLCPFHDDVSTPSLWCRDDHRSGKPRWGCNVCGISDDVIGWFEQYHELPLNAAVDLLRYRLRKRYDEFGR